MAALLSKQQTETGAWRVPARRFVSEAEDIALTATSIRALRVYAPRRDRAAYEPVMQRAAAWLAKAVPDNTEGRAFQLLGLSWSGAAPERMREAARALVASQLQDGGWSQLASAPSDAYATGQALFALLETEMLTPADPVYARAAGFLLKSQREDGSWFQKARPPMPPHVDTGYPIGRDEVASLAATNWASMALALGVR
jgi:squalene-hopene/tetraprenyl-beta-curcumene cyclase